MKTGFKFAGAGLLAAALLVGPAGSASAGNLVPNGDFSVDANADGWPDGWPRPDGATWEKEDGIAYVRLRQTEPGKQVAMFRLIPLLGEHEALEISYRVRHADVKRGGQNWHDARIIVDFKDAEGNKLRGGPGAPYLRSNTNEWREGKVQFLIPEGAVSIEIMPTLFNVERGTMDLADIALRAVSSEGLRAAAAERKRERARLTVPAEEPRRDKWPKEIKVVGNRLHDSDGQEVWLQGVNIASLEWTPTGENVMKSMVVAVDEWKSNVIRLPVKDDYWFGGGNNEGEAYRTLVDNVITLAANRGAYVVLDLHRYRAMKEEYIKFWEDAAARYKNHPAVLFGMINEPHGISWKVWRDGGVVPEQSRGGEEDFFLGQEELTANKRGFISPGMPNM